MGQQGVDLRRSAAIVRRHKRLYVGIVISGFLIAAAYGVIRPPMLASTALVVLPQAPISSQSGSGSSSSGGSSGSSGSSSGSSGSSGYTATEVLIAGSDPVLSGAVRSLGSGISLQTVRDDVKVSAVTDNVIAVTAQSKNAARAEKMANAVANSYLAYVGAATSPVGHIRASMLQGATTATGPTLLKQMTVEGIIGILAGALIGFIVVLAVGRNDRRLRERDDIANSIGVPVLMSIPVEHPSDAPEWITLITEYEPGIVHAWRLRQALQHLGVRETAPGSEPSSVVSVGILSLASDHGALALGPHLVAYAASLGIRTALIVGPQQDATATAALRTACAGLVPGNSKRANFLRVVAADGAATVPSDAELVVAVAVVDGRTPQVPEMPPSTSTLLALSAGAATAEELARVAAIAAGEGRDVSGILVADPDPSDQTTGRIPRLGGFRRRVMPTRIHGIPTESRR